MIDELETIHQRRRDTREGMIRWVKSLRENIPTAARLVLAAEDASLSPDLPGAIKRVLDACADEDIVDMLALCAGAHLYGDLAKHIRSVRFVESEAERVARERQETMERVVLAMASLQNPTFDSMPSSKCMFCGVYGECDTEADEVTVRHAPDCAWVAARKEASPVCPKCKRPFYWPGSHIDGACR